MIANSERMDRFLLASVLLHGGLFALVLLSPNLFPSLGPNWGSEDGGTDSGIQVKIVGSTSGIPLPAPPVVSETAAANDSPSLYKSEEPPPAPPVPDKVAEPIPDATALKKPPAPKPKPAPPASKAAPSPETPPNAVPGPSARPALAYGQFPTGAGEAGIGFGDAVFGDRYGTYVNAITRAISSNWLKSMVDSRVQRAPRVYLTFTIARDGRISSVEVQQSSGIPSLDRSAQRAVLASDPLPPLPSDYRGSDINVRFYFEFSR